MKTYIAATTTVFGLLALAHIWRVIEEGPRLLAQPWYLLVTFAAAALCGWGIRLLLRFPKR